MAKATITSKGQVTIPKMVRERLGLRAGDRLDFELTGDGGVTVRPANAENFGSLAGILHDEIDISHPVTVEEMKRGMEAAVAEHVLSALRDDADDEAS